MNVDLESDLDVIFAPLSPVAKTTKDAYILYKKSQGHTEEQIEKQVNFYGDAYFSKIDELRCLLTSSL